ncbi:MAG: ParB/RepB/Spo0J family partition protein [Desulfobacterales bacterium]|nr:ParB/RepB/Spo0J family partition protein [Desulfobacterales bacterium]
MSEDKPKKQPAAGRQRKKVALGRGLDALIPDLSQEKSAPRDFFSCEIDRIRPNRYQPRRQFSETDLDELRRSIAEQGVLQPLLVRPDGGGYELIAGERRLRAAKMAGLTAVPVVVKTISDSEMLAVSIIENIQRADLNPLEEADAYHRLMTEFSLTQEQVADRVGKGRPTVANFLRLRSLPEPIQASILSGELSMGHARALLSAESGARQLAAWRRVIKDGLSVRETEALVRRLKNEAPPKKPVRTPEDPYFSDLAERLSRRFGTRVKIQRRGKKGKLEIEFYSDDDLDRLLVLLGREP